jgi:tetratricopeptide (TPR) repeat protein
MSSETETMSSATWRDVPKSVWALGFVSLLMDVSSELIHSLLPIFLVTVIGTSMAVVGLIEGVAEATAAIAKVFSGALSDRIGKRKLLVGIGYGLAAVTKPVFPLASSAWEVLAARFVDRIGKGIRDAPRARWHLYAGLAATWVILIALIVSGPRSHSAGFSSGVTPWTYLLNQPAMIAQYVKLAFWPHGLVFDYGLPRAVELREAWPYAIVVLACLVATGAAWFKRPALAFLGAWFFVTLAPSSSIIPIATEVGAERRMYLPLMAIIVGSVIGGELLLAHVSSLTDSRRRRRVTAVCLAGLYCVLTALTLQRSGEYLSRTGIWQSVLDRRPNGRAHYNLAIELEEQGNRAEAVHHYQLALTDEPAAHYAVGFELDADGKHEEAIPHYREYIRLMPSDINVIRAYVLLGRALTSTGQLGPAVDAFQQAVQRQPANVDARAGLAEALLKLERYDDAIQAYREYVRWQPNDANAHSGLGMALVGRERDDEAVLEFARAVELEPNDAGRHYNLGNALASTGRLDEAVSHYRRGLELAPGNVSLHNALGLVLAARGQTDEALAQFRQSLDLDPANEQTRKDFATAFPRRLFSDANSKDRPR